MNEIKNVVLCGLGAIGTLIATDINKADYINLKILVDKDRLKRYTVNPRKFNSEICRFNYVLPDTDGFTADLIIISTKNDGLDWAINNIKNFVAKDTIIISLLNGIKSEEQIHEIYNNKEVYSFMIGSSTMRNSVEILHTGTTKVVFGSKYSDLNKTLSDFFSKTNIPFEVREDIITALWQKFAINCCINQVSAITGMCIKDLYECKNSFNLMKNICSEVELVARCEEIPKYNTLWGYVLKSFEILSPDGKPSMLQDIESKRPVEIELFGETVKELGEKHCVETPYNDAITDIIKAMTNNRK